MEEKTTGMADSLKALANPAEHMRALEYLQNLKSDPKGWKECIEKIIYGKLSSAEEHFLYLQVIESYLTNSYANDEDGQGLVKMWMAKFLEQISMSSFQDVFVPVFLMNKVAHLFALIFATDFPCRWPTFLQQVFLEHLDSPQKNLFFLRVLKAIDSEVIDREVQRSKAAFDRNTKIKDAMRDLCVTDMARAWTEFLEDRNDVAVRNLCLQVIARYVDWIDVGLVVNDALIPRIIDCLNAKETSDAAVEAVCAIVDKGMEAEKKLCLISALASLLQENKQLLADPNGSEDELVRSGSLITSIGIALIDCSSRFEKANDTARRNVCRELFESYLSTALMCFAHEDFTVSSTVLDFLRRFVASLKGEPLTAERAAYLSQIISVGVLRYKAPDYVNLEHDGEVEADFLEYRKQLKILLGAVGSIRPDMIVSAIEPSVSMLCEQWKQSEVTPIEATLSLVYCLSEILNSSFIAGVDDVSTRAKNMIFQILNSDVSRSGHTLVNTIFFELVCRYDKLLQANNQPLPQLLEAFLDERGLRHPSARVRTRVVYLFCRFVKAHKQILSGHVGTVLQQLAPLLAVMPQGGSLFVDDDQMFLYEVTSTLIVFGSMETSLKERYMKELCGSLLSKFLSACELLNEPLSEEEALALRRYLGNIITYSSRITKAFTASATMQSCNCDSIFVEMMNVFLEKVQLDSSEMLDPLRQFLHRMVVCIDEQIFPALPLIFSKFLSSGSNLSALHDFLILVQQLFVKFKSRLLNTGLNVHSLFEVVWAAQQTAQQDIGDENIARSLCYLNRAYLQLVLCIIANSLLPLLTSCGHEFMKLFGNSVLSLCACSDPVAQRVALLSVGKLFLGSYQQGTSEYVEMFWERAVLAALQVLLSKQRDTSDAQYILVQHEASACLQVLRELAPVRFDCVISSVLPPPFAGDISRCLSTRKGKERDVELDEVYEKVRQANAK